MDDATNKLYKVVVIGAGPSGLSTALNLLKYGITDILVVERGKFPRYKCCAGYITSKTGKAYAELGLNPENCHYTLIKDFKIVYRLKPRLNIQNKFLYTNRKIDRVELDNSFFELAKSKGIEITESRKILQHDPQKNQITLTDGQTIGYETLVFADGTLGFGSRYQNAKRKNIALQLTFPSDRSDEIAIHFGISKKGYGWISSYGGVTNAGLTDLFDESKNYRKIFAEFLEKSGIEADLKNLKGAFTPIGIRKPVIHRNMFYVGDAVGACDPLTLSGLRYALSSGAVCAKAIGKNRRGIYARYIMQLRVRFGFMKILSKLFYLRPVLFLVFNVACRFFGKFVSHVFNHFFVNKK